MKATQQAQGRSPTCVQILHINPIRGPKIIGAAGVYPGRCKICTFTPLARARYVSAGLEIPFAVGRSTESNESASLLLRMRAVEWLWAA